MKIFQNRPLSLILCIILGGFSIFSFITSNTKYSLFLIPLIILCLSFINHGQIKKRKRIIILSSIILLISLVASHIYFDLWFTAYKRFEDAEVKIEGTVTKISENYYNTDITINTDNINGVPLTRYKILLSLPKDEAETIAVNTRISFKTQLEEFNSKDSDFDYRSYYFSKGYSAKATHIKNYIFISKTSEQIEAKIYNFRASLSKFIIENSDEESGGLLTALLLGERDYLSQQMTLDFKRIGITHMLALSGLNLTILVLGFSKLLSLFIGKKLRYIINIILTLAYITLTGLSLSVVRAGFMLMITSLVFLFSRQQDSITALICSVTLICIANPYSIFDIGLWLSAFATLGILILAELPKKQVKNQNIILKFASMITHSFSISLFALSATFAISLLAFEEISIISPITTFIFSIIMEAFMYIGTLMILSVGFLPLSKTLSFLGNIIKELSSWFSDFKYVCISSDFLLVRIFAVIFTALLILFIILNIRKKKLMTYLISSLMCIILITGAICSYNAKSNELLYYTENKGCESILINQDNKTSIITQASYSRQSAYNDINLLNKEKITYLEAYVFTSYSRGLCYAIETMLSNIRIEKIYLPNPQSKDELLILKSIKELSENFRTELILYNNYEILKLSGIEFSSKYREEYSGNTTRNIFEIKYEKKIFTYLSSGILKDDTKYEALKHTQKSNGIIFGSHGTDYYNTQFSYEIEGLDFIAFASENLFVPGSVEYFYEKIGAVIYTAPERINLLYIE